MAFVDLKIIIAMAQKSRVKHSFVEQVRSMKRGYPEEEY